MGNAANTAQSKIQFDYYYGVEAEQFSFYRVPRLLIKDERFKGLSSDAKLLYGLMLDRMSLSMKNGWLDAENRAYIYYTMDEIMDDLGCAREKCAKIIAELDNRKGIGLIQKKRQGLGKPDIIYVMNFAVKDAANPDKSTEVRKSNFKKFENQTSGSSEFGLQEVRKSNPNYTDNNQTEKNQTEGNQIHLIHQADGAFDDAVPERADEIDWMDENEESQAYVRLIKDNIEYDHHMSNDNSADRALYQELFEIICEVVCLRHKSVRIGGEDYPHEAVKSRFLKLDSSHLEYVIDCMKETTTKVGNIKAYLLTALYNAPSTMKHYYQQEVNHDMYGGGWAEKVVG